MAIKIYTEPPAVSYTLAAASICLRQKYATRNLSHNLVRDPSIQRHSRLRRVRMQTEQLGLITQVWRDECMQGRSQIVCLDPTEGALGGGRRPRRGARRVR